MMPTAATLDSIEILPFASQGIAVISAEESGSAAEFAARL